MKRISDVPFYVWPLLATVIGIFFVWPEDRLKINMHSCMPEGFSASISERIDPKKFWIAQNIELEMAIQKWDIATSMLMCHDQKATAEQERCLEYKRNLYESAVKCYQTTSQLCRANGGNC